MILTQNEKIFVIHRKIFEGDITRYFVGTVDGYQDGIARVSGHTWIKDDHSGDCIKKNDNRTEILSITSGNLIVYELPHDVEIEKISFITEKNGSTSLTDKGDFKLDITERKIKI